MRVDVRSAALTTELAHPSFVRYLAVWRFPAEARVRSKTTAAATPPQLVWERLERVARPEPAYVYAPAFSLQRLPVQQLGAALVECQPRLFLEQALPPEQPPPPRLVEGSPSRQTSDRPTRPSPVGREPATDGRPVAGDGEWDFALDPGFATLSPVLLTEEDARAVAHFIYLAVESRNTPDLRGIDYELELGPGELIFVPAVYDRRHVRDCNWRWLLKEFDGLVA